MERNLITAIVFAASSFGLMAKANSVAPSDVKYDEGSVAVSISGAAGDADMGRKIVGSKKLGNCVACHQVNALVDIPFQGEIGPPLDGAGERWSVPELRGIVSNAKMMFEDSLMPSFYKTEGFIRPGKAYTGKAADDTFAPLLDAQQIEDVVAYLATLKE